MWSSYIEPVQPSCSLILSYFSLRSQLGIMPPIQVGDSCNRWKLKLPEQFSLPQDGTGVGVTVFVLDTLPKPEDITSAASNPGSNNSLLASMAQNMVIVASDGTVSPPGATSATPPAIKVNYTLLPDVLYIPSPDQPATGKDIYDRLVGFPMVDHGLFVAGGRPATSPPSPLL